ncbi:MAG: glycosyltransferase, partial [Candidatus Baldrarchaeia archaeon]
AYNTPGLKDAVKDGETGYLVPYGDIEKLASKIVEILTNHKLRRKMEQKAVKWARRFSWDVSSEKMLKTIEKVVSHNHTHGHELHDSPKQAPIRNTKKTIPYM